MDFWLLDVQNIVSVNGTDVAFDYINTYFDKNEAISEAKLLSMDDNVLEISVHHWILLENDEEKHVEDINCGVDCWFKNKDC